MKSDIRNHVIARELGRRFKRDNEAVMNSRELKKRAYALSKEKDIPYATAMQQVKSNQQKKRLGTLGGIRRLWSEAMDAIPTTPVTDPNEIRALLRKVAALPNHMFFPWSGGLDLHDVRPGPNGHDEIWTRGTSPGRGRPSHYAKIKSIQKVGSEELGSGVLLRLDDLGHKEWQSGVMADLSDVPYDAEGPDRTRLNRGQLLVVWKGGAYNGLNQTYDGRHQWLQPDELGEYLDDLDLIRRDLSKRFTSKEDKLRAGGAAGRFVGDYEQGPGVDAAGDVVKNRENAVGYTELARDIVTQLGLR